jgi:hypothetical protein
MSTNYQPHANFNGTDKHLYLGNKHLPTDRAEFEWTPEMVANLKKCKKNLLYFAENHFTIVNLDRGKEKIQLFKCQKTVLRSLRDNRFNVVMASRQVGKTTMMTIYALWIACFQEDQRILVVANKELTAINIFKRIRMAYEQLPNWLKPGVIEYGKTSMTLSNGSSVGISTTSSDAGRGDSCNVLILDELAFIDNHLVQDFWKSVYPIISSSKKSKIFIASTPNGTGNLFHDLYTNAVKGKNNWKASRIDWWEIPDRDEKWKQETIKSLGSVQIFDQEFGCQFIETGESVIDDELMRKVSLTLSEPKHIFDDGNYMLWCLPNEEHSYAIGVDISEGVGEAASVVQILDITDLTEVEQVAVYHDNNISPYNFTTKLLEILQQWGNPPALIERNNCGAQVVDTLQNVHGYENIVNYSPSKTNSVDRPGVIAHTNTKYKGVVNMKYWLSEVYSVILHDSDTLEELKTFVRYPNGTWKAMKGLNIQDDRVMSLIWALMILETDITEQYFEIVERDKNNKPSRIKSLDYGEKYFSRTISLYNDENPLNDYSALPLYIDSQTLPGQADGTGNRHDGDITSLQEQGWELI